ncbi:MAG: hypothetical protein II937_00850 [Bacteroidales bacterium]|nr:hypothetical protein [Bacteroidales bacterium]
MPLDFFKRKFVDQTDEKVFGLCDDSTDGNTLPAYLDVSDDLEKWIAIVKNEPQILVEFYPIDGFISWKRTDGTMSGRCDGMLCFNEKKNIIFVELKGRKVKGDWRDDGKTQLKETLEKFFSINNRLDFQCIEAYICNKRQLLKQRYSAFEQNFKTETGITLRVKREIEIKNTD